MRSAGRRGLTGLSDGGNQSARQGCTSVPPAPARSPGRGPRSDATRPAGTSGLERTGPPTLRPCKGLRPRGRSTGGVDRATRPEPVPTRTGFGQGITARDSAVTDTGSAPARRPALRSAGEELTARQRARPTTRPRDLASAHPRTGTKKLGEPLTDVDEGSTIESLMVERSPT